MTTTTFDTLAYAKRFKSAGFSDQQAKEVVTALRDVRDARMEEMATKGDLQQLEIKLESGIAARIAEAKTETIKWMVGLLLAQTGLIITVFKLFPSH